MSEIDLEKLYSAIDRCVNDNEYIISCVRIRCEELIKHEKFCHYPNQKLMILWASENAARHLENRNTLNLSSNAFYIFLDSIIKAEFTRCINFQKNQKGKTNE